MRNPRIVLGLTLLASLPTAPVHADVVLRAVTTDHGRSTPATHTNEVRVAGPNVRIDVDLDEDGGARMSVIFRGDERKMLAVDHREESVTVIDREMVQAVTGQIQQALRQFEAQLEGMSEEERAAMKRLLGGQMETLRNLGEEAPAPPPTEVRTTDERAERSGFPCIRQEVWSEGARIREFWVTEWSRVEGGAETRAALLGMAEFAEELFESVKGSFPGLDFADMGNPFQDVRELAGLPVVTRLFDDAALTSETVVEWVRRAELEDGTFRAPAGYATRDIAASAR